MKTFSTERVSIIGDSHHAEGSDCQDSASIAKTDELCLLLVSDGVSSNKDSKVGSTAITQVARRVILQTSAALLTMLGNSSEKNLPGLAKLFTSWLNTKLREELSSTAQFLSDYQALEDPLAATLLGCVITPKVWFIFGCGDGVVMVNGQLYVIEGREPHLPNLLTESLPAGTPEKDRQSQGHIDMLYCGLTDKLQTVAIGTDGAIELLPSLVNGQVTSNPTRSARVAMFPRDDMTIVSAKRLLS